MRISEIGHSENLNENLSICAGMTHETGESDYKGIQCADGAHGVIYSSENGEVCGVCMPSPCALGCSFDRELLRNVGKAVGSMAAEGGFNAVLSPEAGVLRSPLYGGASECFGEDPYVCGSLCSEWVSGVQSVGTAAILKNFMGANQSNGKFTCDSIIDKRALREIYLKPFEMTVKLAQPKAVYCGVNKINGLECCENPVLLTDILRREWKFDGAVLADMRLCPNCAASMSSGVDMSYPGGGRGLKRKLKKAVENEKIPSHYPEISAKRDADIVNFSAKSCGERMSEEECKKLARHAAAQCAVLLKNHKNTLPIPLSSSIALIGRQAKFPRTGGRSAGSEPAKNMLNVFDDNRVRYKYCEGYDENSKTNEGLLSQAVKCAAESEFAVIFAGFDSTKDNLSCDRRTNQLSKGQIKLINSIAKVNSNTIVVINCSALPKMNWIGKIKAVLYMPLCGDEMCGAAFDLLFGFANPCGRLTVSSSLNESDMPCVDTFGSSEYVSEYRESIYVGYRYYNKAGIYAAFPFGYGLSYTAFKYSGMKSVKCSEGWQISLKVKNVGKRDGAEIVQFYVEAPKTEKFRPVRELKQFHKVYLAKGEVREISIILPREAFAFYDTEFNRFRVTSGRYRVYAAAASNDLRAEIWISVKGEASPKYDVPAWYIRPSGKPKDTDFCRLFGKRMPEIKPVEKRSYSVSCTLNQLKSTWIFGIAVKAVRKIAYAIIQPENPKNPEYAEKMDYILNMPVYRLVGLCRGLYPLRLTGLIIKIANMRGGRLQ